MKITYDPAKNAANIGKHGLSFEAAYGFDFIGCLTVIDIRKNYGETRLLSTGLCNGRLHVLCYIETRDGIRTISFRKANRKESKKYEKETA